jgi:hypothetical protein
MNFIYDNERREIRYTTADLYRLIKKWKAIKIKDLLMFKNFYRAYQRVAGWLHIRGKINSDDFKLWFWVGLHRRFQKKVEARMRIDDRGLDDSKAFEVAKIVEVAQKVFTQKRFENRVKLMLEKSRDPEDDSDSEESDEDPDEDEESDVEEDEDSRTDVLTARDLRKGKERRVTFREPERPVETATRPTSDTPVNELIDKMRCLQLTDRILFNQAIQADPALRYVLGAPTPSLPEKRPAERDIPPHMNRTGSNYIDSHWGQGYLDFSWTMLSTLQALRHFAQHLPSRNILFTFRM